MDFGIIVSSMLGAMFVDGEMPMVSSNDHKDILDVFGGHIWSGLGWSVWQLVQLVRGPKDKETMPIQPNSVQLKSAEHGHWLEYIMQIVEKSYVQVDCPIGHLPASHLNEPMLLMVPSSLQKSQLSYSVNGFYC